MSTNMLSANVSTSDSIDLSPRAEMALVANADEQEEYLTRLRANAVKQARKERGTRAAKWQKRAFKKLDQAFAQGFYSSPRANSVTANDSRFDFEEHEDRDPDNLQEVRTNLTMMDAVMSAGFSVSSSLARTEYIQQRESKWEVAGEVSMDGRAESRPDEAVLERFGVPITIAHVDYEIPARQQQQSQNFGEDIETRKARQAGRILRETEENLFLDGWGPTTPDSQGNNLDLYGVRDSSVSITGSASGDWGTASNIKDTIDAILNDLESQTTNNDRGPDPVEQGAWLWYHPNQRSDLRAADPDGDGNMTVMTRLQQDYPYLDMSAAGELADGELVCTVKDPRFVEIINAQGPTNLSEEVDFGLATQYKALSARVPFFKKTYDGVKGNVYYTGA